MLVQQVQASNFTKSLLPSVHNPHHSFPRVASLHPQLSHSFLSQVHIGCKTYHVFISTNPLLCCDSKVCIVCGSAVEALPDHLWSSCIVTILLLTNLPVVWQTGRECLQGQAELSNAAGCMVSDQRTLCANTDSINNRLLICYPDDWGVWCALLTVAWGQWQVQGEGLLQTLYYFL